MEWFSIRRLSSAGLAMGILAALASSAHAQLLDRLRGRETRPRIEDERVERYYVPPGQGERVEQYREGRVYRGDSEIRGDAEFRGGTEYRGGERTQLRSSSRARRGTTLIGSTVRLEGGRTLGRVDDIVISESGCVEFMVVSVSGLRGMSGRLAVLPFTIGEADFSRRVVYVDWAEEDLRRAPIFFSASAWPDFSDTRWTADVFAYFDVESHDEFVGRAYREPRDMERGRIDERSSRDRDSRARDYDRDDERSYREQESRRREGSERSTRQRDSDREQDQGRSDRRFRGRDTSEDEGSDRDTDDESKSDDESNSKSSTRPNRSNNRDLPE